MRPHFPLLGVREPIQPDRTLLWRLGKDMLDAQHVLLVDRTGLGQQAV